MELKFDTRFAETLDIHLPMSNINLHASFGVTLNICCIMCSPLGPLLPLSQWVLRTCLKPQRMRLKCQFHTLPVPGHEEETGSSDFVAGGNADTGVIDTMCGVVDADGGASC